MIQIPLSKPISAHGESLTVLELHEPTMKVARKIGLPYLVTTGGSIDIDVDRICRYVAELAGIPPSSVDQICLSDLGEIQGVIMSFFGPSGTTTSSASITLRDGGA